MEDENWRDKADKQVLWDLIEDLQDRLRELDSILKGERGRGGLISEYERHDALLTRIYAVLWQDATGQKGMLHDVDTLMGRRSHRERSSEFKWKFWTAVIVAIISSGGLLLSQWTEIKKVMLPPPALAKKINQAKRPKGKPIYRVRVISPTPSDATKESPPSPPP